MTTLFIVEHDNRQFEDGTRRALTAAIALGAPVHVLVAGGQCSAVADEVAQIAGPARVLVIEDPSLGQGLAEPLADVVASLVKARTYTAVAAAASSAGKNLMPRLAGLLDVMVIPDIIAVEGTDVFVRPIYAGNALERLRSRDAIKVITVRASAFAEAPIGGDKAPVERVQDMVPAPSGSRLVRREFIKSERPTLSAANVVVAGGRALASAGNFETILAPLADALGGALGASRAAVDAGFAPNDWQVGQTGKIVAPDLYIAVGISGAIQHMAGMKDSKVIIAINTDAEAPIFQIADYGLVADALTAVPELVAKLKARAA